MTTMIRTRILFPLVAGALSIAACSSQSPQANAPATNAAAQANTNAKAEHEDHHGVPFFGAALALDDLTPQQRTKLESIRTGVESQGASRKAAMKQLGDLFAKALDDGKLDEAAASAQIDALAQAVDAEKPSLAKALDDLHAILTPTQRAEVVARMHAHHGKHEGKGDAKGDGKDEQGEKDEHEAKGGGEGMHDGMHLRMKQLADDLALTPEQRAAYKDKLSNGPRPLEAEHDAIRAQMKAVADAFVSDGFDAKALDVGKYAAPMAKAFATRIERFVAVSIEILDPGQRAKLAAKVRERTAKMAG